MKAIVFDTETINVADVSMFDFGFTIIDTDTGKELQKGSYLIDDIYNSELFKKAYYYNKNKEIYETKLHNNEIEIKSLAEVRIIFNKAIKEHEVTLIGGFIIAFDIRVLNTNFTQYLNDTKKIELSILSNKYEVLDISILFSLLEKRFGDYVEFCIDNGHLTDKGNIKSTAEVIYKYVSGNQEHEEEHTAYNDSVEEATILKYCLDNYGKYPEFNSIWEEAKEITLKNNKKAWQILK